MRFYTKQHKYYCGIDLHTKKLYVCVLSSSGEIMAYRNLDADPDAFLELTAPYREDVVVAAECMFTWYWVAYTPHMLKSSLSMRRSSSAFT